MNRRSFIQAVVGGGLLLAVPDKRFWQLDKTMITPPTYMYSSYMTSHRDFSEEEALIWARHEAKREGYIFDGIQSHRISHGIFPMWTFRYRVE